MAENKRKRIGVDFDDVLNDFNAGLIAHYNARYNTSFKREDVKEYYVEKLFGRTPEEMFEEFTDFCFSEKHNMLEPVVGSKEAITLLAQEYDLYIITARARVLKEVTETWLDLHFPGVFKEIHYSRDQWKDTNKKKKSVMAQEVGVHYFIEDSRENAFDIAQIDIPIFLLNAPWNQGELPEQVTRVHHWEEIPKILLS